MPSTTSPQFIRRVESPIGRIELTSDGESITSLVIERKGHVPHDSTTELSNAVLDRAAEQLAEYFAGTRRDFDLPTKVTGSEFQRGIWSGLCSIPWGEATSYGLLGETIGKVSAGRAVGGAVGANPLPIIVPCHRVLATGGLITGYSGGNGIPTKTWLLEHEGIPHKLPGT